MQRRVDKEKANSKNFDEDSIIAIRNILWEGTITQELTHITNEVCGFNVKDVAMYSPDLFVSEQESALQLV